MVLIGSTDAASATATHSGRLYHEGLKIIQQAYVRDVSLAELAQSGLRSLSELDGQVQVATDGRSVDIRLGDAVVLREALPGGQDARRWAGLMSRAIDGVRAVSTPVGRATTMQIHELVFKGILSRLDPFTRFLGDVEAYIRTEGDIGVVLAKNGTRTEVAAVSAGSPAEAVGVQRGDVVVEIDSRPTEGLGSEDILRLLRGEIGSSVSVRLERAGEPLARTMIRAEPSSFGTSSTLEEGILHVRTTMFYPERGRLIRRELKKAMGDGLKGVILDLRSTLGGLLDEAAEVADCFLPAGPIASIKGRASNLNREILSDRAHLPPDVPVVVLINGQTGGGSELIAAALQDRARGLVVGSSTVGKGSVQTVFPLSEGAALALTTGQLYRGSGEPLEERGVAPDVCTSVENDGSGDNLESLAERIERRRSGPRKSAPSRDECPPSDREPERDVALARAILKQPELYRRCVR